MAMSKSPGVSNKVTTAKMAAGEVAPSELTAAKMTAGELAPTEVAAAKMTAAEVAPAEVAPAEAHSERNWRIEAAVVVVARIGIPAIIVRGRRDVGVSRVRGVHHGR